MFRIHIGSTPNNLTDDDFKVLADHTEGFSGSDISVIVRDALYEPVRTCQTATHFKYVNSTNSHPSCCRYVVSLSTCLVHRKEYDPKNRTIWHYVPCGPSDRGAEEMSIFDIASDKLKPLVRRRFHSSS